MYAKTAHSNWPLSKKGGDQKREKQVKKHYTFQRERSQKQQIDQNAATRLPPKWAQKTTKFASREHTEGPKKSLETTANVALFWPWPWRYRNLGQDFDSVASLTWPEPVCFLGAKMCRFRGLFWWQLCCYVLVNLLFSGIFPFEKWFLTCFLGSATQLGREGSKMGSFRVHSCRGAFTLLL